MLLRGHELTPTQALQVMRALHSLTQPPPRRRPDAADDGDGNAAVPAAAAADGAAGASGRRRVSVALRGAQRATAALEREQQQHHHHQEQEPLAAESARLGLQPGAAPHLPPHGGASASPRQRQLEGSGPPADAGSDARKGRDTAAGGGERSGGAELLREEAPRGLLPAVQSQAEGAGPPPLLHAVMARLAERVARGSASQPARAASHVPPALQLLAGAHPALLSDLNVRLLGRREAGPLLWCWRQDNH